MKSKPTMLRTGITTISINKYQPLVRNSDMPQERIAIPTITNVVNTPKGVKYNWTSRPRHKNAVEAEKYRALPLNFQPRTTEAMINVISNVAGITPKASVSSVVSIARYLVRV